jgi:hypothetical protein
MIFCEVSSKYSEILGGDMQLSEEVEIDDVGLGHLPRETQNND